MVAMMDNNIWGLLVVPVGVCLGFGPVIVAWLWETHIRPDPPEPPSPREPRPRP
jgi:hypothetical protein